MVSSSVIVSTIIIGLFSPFLASSIGKIGPATGQQRDFQQVYKQKEFHASNVYLTFAHRLVTHGVYLGFADFFFDFARKKHDHGKRLVDYNNVRNTETILENIFIPEEVTTMTDLIQMIDKAKQLEDDVYNNLLDVRVAADRRKDYPTVHFIDKQMLEEQITTVKYMTDLQTRIQRGPKGSAIILQMMDQDLRKKQVKKTIKKNKSV